MRSVERGKQLKTRLENSPGPGKLHGRVRPQEAREDAIQGHNARLSQGAEHRHAPHGLPVEHERPLGPLRMSPQLFYRYRASPDYADAPRNALNKYDINSSHFNPSSSRDWCTSVLLSKSINLLSSHAYSKAK